MMINDQQLKTCTICKQVYELKTNNDMIKHFKQKHCSMTGESYKCNICCNKSNLSNVNTMFTQFEYDAHVLKNHNGNHTPNGLDNTIEQVAVKKHNHNNIQKQATYNFLNVPFSADLTAVLNDPRKDRVKTTNLFTKTWGSDFIEEPSFPEFATKKFPIVSSSDFKQYFSQISTVCCFILVFV